MSGFVPVPVFLQEYCYVQKMSSLSQSQSLSPLFFKRDFCCSASAWEKETQNGAPQPEQPLICDRRRARRPRAQPAFCHCEPFGGFGVLPLD